MKTKTMQPYTLIATALKEHPGLPLPLHPTGAGLGRAARGSFLEQTQWRGQDSSPSTGAAEASR